MNTKVLFADDDLLVHQLYQPHLERAGYHLIKAGNGREAIEAARRERPEIAVLDIVMPEMNGIAALRELKGLEWAGNIPVILITADTECYRYSREILTGGAAILLMKPFSPEQLLSVIRVLLHRAHQTAGGSKDKILRRPTSPSSQRSNPFS